MGKKAEKNQKGSVFCENHRQKDGFWQGDVPAPATAEKPPEGKFVLADADPVSHSFRNDGNRISIWDRGLWQDQ